MIGALAGVLHSQRTLVSNDFITSDLIRVSYCEDARILHSSLMAHLMLG